MIVAPTIVGRGQFARRAGFSALDGTARRFTARERRLPAVHRNPLAF